jgi:hypothetical protein
MIIISYVLGIFFGTSEIKYSCGLPLFIFIGILLFNIFKNPYLEKRHSIRVVLLFIMGTILISLILVQNILNIQLLKSYLPAIIIGA